MKSIKNLQLIATKSKEFRNVSAITFFSVSILASAAEKPRKNILFLMADDFNYWTKAQGYYPQAISPNLDKLAAKGMLFTNAHCSSPVSNPSRNSLWSGFRPSTTGIQGNADGYIRDIPGFANIKTMNQYFKENGYWVYGAGKLYHTFHMADNNTVGDIENFSERYKGYPGSQAGDLMKWTNPDWTDMFWSVNQEPMTEANNGDYKLAKTVATFISGYSTSANKDKPFFIGSGIFRPHLPWHVHKQFYDLFKTEDMSIPKGYKDGDLADTGYGPNASHTGVINADKWKEAIHIYLASLAMSDYNLGVILDALEKSPYKDNTIICFMGDHGWHLGEKERWSKASLWDMASKTTLIVYDPSAKGNAQFCHKVVGLQDLYPTLVELSGVPVKTDIEGSSLAALLENPTRTDWDKPFIGSYNGVDYIQTNNYRYVRDNIESRRMLYDKKDDPYEFDNLYNKSQYAQVISRLNEQLDSVIAIGTNLKSKLLANYRFVPKALTIPGVIEAEDYDEGGYTQTYYDADKINTGGQYRTADGTDIFITDDTKGSYHLNDLAAGDWCNYTIKDYLPGDYSIDFRVKNTGTNPAVLQIFNRAALLTELTIPAGISNWQTIRTSMLTLAEQTSTRLLIKVKSGSGVQLNSMTFEMGSTGNLKVKATKKRKCLINNIIKNNVLNLDLLATAIKATLSIYNTEGKLVLKNAVSGEQTLAYHLPVGLSKGHYFLQISDELTASVEIFIVK